jgi:hypothetical protein
VWGAGQRVAVLIAMIGVGCGLLVVGCGLVILGCAEGSVGRILVTVAWASMVVRCAYLGCPLRLAIGS